MVESGRYWRQKISKPGKMAQNIPNGRKIVQITIKYTNIFHRQKLQNLPKLGFWYEKYAVWQPWAG
jgi:hypothetical protein